MPTYGSLTFCVWGQNPSKADSCRETLPPRGPRIIVHMFFLAVVNAITAGFARIELDEKRTYANSKVSEAIVFECFPGSTCRSFLCWMRVSERNAVRSHNKFCSGRSEGARCSDGSVGSEHSG